MDPQPVQRTLPTPDRRVRAVQEAVSPREPAQGPMSMEPIACSLDGTGQADRLNEWRRLLGQADRPEPVDGGVRFRLPATLAGPAAELAAAEQRCCPFFTFTLHLAGGGLQLEVRAPAEAMPMVAEIFSPDR